jgi:hypothetical protein
MIMDSKLDFLCFRKHHKKLSILVPHFIPQKNRGSTPNEKTQKIKKPANQRLAGF